MSQQATSLRSSSGSSKRWLSAADNSWREYTHRGKSERTDEDQKHAERALRIVYRVILPRLARSGDALPGVLGFSRPSMARACVRNHEFFVAMAEELGEWWMRTIHEAELASESDWRLIERDHMDEAAELLLRAVSELPVPQREVLVRRASGMSWKGIAEALPHRAYFSMTDDWATALRSLWSRQGDLIRRIV